MQQCFVFLCFCKFQPNYKYHIFVFGLFFVVLNLISVVYLQIIYQCNFDDKMITDHCFTSAVAVTSSAGIVTINIPNAPLSDVTSSRKTNYYSRIV